MEASDAEIDDDLIIELDVDEESVEAAAPAPVSDELDEITAALESEGPVGVAGAPSKPDAGAEESLEEVFAAFREKVDEEVGSEDFRTHYDLGIGYKEMGLIEEAMAEFERSCPSEEVGREARVMLAVCHRELGQVEQAVRWYREALDLGGGEPGGLLELRYDLAEVLIESGETAAAQQLLREVADADPSFRDVKDRLNHLQARQNV
jgi:tetratricopeptide (TPR) repeat protein